MTKAEKETQRKRIMWVALIAIIFVMFGIIGLVWVDKPVADLGLIAGAYFSALAGLIGASLWTKPGVGADDSEKNGLEGN